MTMKNDSNQKPGGAHPEIPSHLDDSSRKDRMISGLQADHQIKISLPDGQYDLKHLLDEVLKARGVNDLFTKAIIGALIEIRHIHLKLAEWKELHNYLNVILVKSGDVKIELLRMNAEGISVQDYPTWRSGMRIKWSSTKTKTEDLLEWLKKIRFIEETPFWIAPNHKMGGPKWVINLQLAHNDIMKFLDGEEMPTPEDAIGNFLIFISQIEDRMYEADQKLRETAGDLNTKSELVLGSLGDD